MRTITASLCGMLVAVALVNSNGYIQDERTLWILACFRNGDLVKTATYPTVDQCNMAAILEGARPGVSCLCRPNRIYRPKRGKQ
jgi:hypothetical protein